MKRIDLVNPWQRREAARLIRMYRSIGVVNPIETSAQHAYNNSRNCDTDFYIASALQFISEQLNRAQGNIYHE